MLTLPWARRSVLRLSPPRTAARRSPVRLRLGQLEERCVPATFRWVTAAGGDFATPANWEDQAGNPGVPAAADDAVILLPGVTVTSGGANAVRHLTSTGTFRVTGGTFAAAAANFAGTAEVAGGDLLLGGPSTAGTVVLSAGTLGGAGHLRLTGGMTWAGGTLGADLNVADHATLDITGAGPKALDNVTLTNDGTLAWAGAGGLEFRGATTVRNNGLFRDLADHSLTVTGTAAVLLNPGEYVKEAGAGVSDLDVRFDNTGTVRAEAGTLRLSDEIAQVEFGQLEGGTWYIGGGATLDLPGTFLSGNAADVTFGGPAATFGQFEEVSFNTGHITVTGGATFTSDEFLFTRGRLTVGPGSTLALAGLDFGIGGRLTLQVAGRPATNQFGRVTTTSGTDFSDGTLGLTLLPGADPVAGDGYTFVTAASVSNTPAVVQDGVGAAAPFNVSIGATTVTATAVLAVTDLAVTAVNPPAPAAPGADVTVTWTVTNNAAVATAVTDWSDAVYVSASPTFDATAVLVGRSPHAGGLAGGGSYGGSLTAPLPGLPAGSYHVFVRTDVNAAVPDPDRANNLGVTGTTFAVTDPSALTPGVDANATVAAGEDAWFRVDAPGGTALVVTATLPAGAGELYVGYGKFPGLDDALGAATDPVAATQRVVLPTTQAGRYYVRVRGLAGAGAGLAVAVRAETPNFNITHLVHAAGSNQGSATLTVHGVGFAPTTTVSLVPAVGPARAASRLLYVDSDTVYATFDLKGLATGSYDVRVTDGARIATAAGGYTVTNAPIGVITYRVVQPAFMRSNDEPAYATIEYVNTGGTDLPAPLLLLSTHDGSVRLLDQPAGEEEFGDFRQYFLPTSTDAPAGLLPPGYRGSLKVELSTFQSDGSTFDLLLEEVKSAPVPWSDFKLYLRNRDIPVDAWNGIFANFLATVGKTSDTFAAALRNAATYLAAVGTPVWDAGGLFGHLLRRADAAYPGRALAAANDASFPAPGLALDFSRTLPPSVTGRYWLGRLGRGWVDNWDISVAYPGFGERAVVHTAGAARAFETDTFDGTVYRATDGSEDVLEFDGTRFVLTEHDGTVTAFRPDGQLDYLHEPGGNRVTAGYDATTSRLTTLTHSDGRALTFTTNKAGRITSLTDPAGRVTTFKYLGDRLLSATGPGGTEKYAYLGGAPGRKYALASVTAPDGVKTAFTYDKLGRLIKRTVGATEAVTYAYGPGGGVTATPTGSPAVTYLSDYHGRVFAVRDAAGADLRLGYDAAGRSARVESSAGQVWTTSRDEHGRPAAVTDPLGHVVRYAYDHHTAALAGYTDARGHTTSYQSDAAGNTLAVTYPGGAAERFVYDPVGNLVASTNRRGNTIQYLTDADGRVTRRVFADGSTTDYTYDARGHLTAATDASGTVGLTYTPQDRLLRVTYPDGRFLEFTYDKGGRRTGSVDQDGFRLAYTYDAAGRLAEVRDGASALVVKYTYDAAGRPGRKDAGNGTFVTYAYDAAGRLATLINHAPSGADNSRFDYTYDAAGHVATMTTGGATTAYGYDLNGQLTSVVAPGRTITYAYDAAGNRTSVTDNGVTTPYTVNALNQVTAMGATAYTYDADGNRETMTDAGGTTTYGWDDLNRLIGVTDPDDTFAYTYDPLDQLWKTTHDGQTTTNLTDPFGLGSVTAQYGPGGLLAHYVQGLGLEARVDAAGGKAFYDFDQLGSVVGLTDGVGAYVNRYAYLPFGETTTLAAGLANPFTFVGRWGISADGNGLFNMRARNYDAATGQFLSDDPLGLAAGDPNVRRYVNNNPANFADPSGLKCTEDQLNDLTRQLEALNKTPELQRYDGMMNEFKAYQDQLLRQPPGATVTLHDGKSVTLSELLSRKSQFQHMFGEHPKVVERRDLQTAIADCTKELEKAKRLPDLKFASPGRKPVPGTKPARQTSQQPTNVNNTPNRSNGPAGVGGKVGKGPRGGSNAAGTSQQPYSTDFENPAAVPLHTLRVSQQLDSDFDPATFELGDLRLGELTIDVPDGRSSYRTRIDARDTWGVFIDVNAGIDRTTGQVAWDLTALDPATMEVPLAADLGLLPPVPFDPASRRGTVYYSMGARADVADGASLDVTASLTFDGGAPVATPTLSNVVDAAPPAATVNPLPARSGAAFTVSWTGNDGTGGTGVAFCDVFVSVDGGSFVRWLSGATIPSAIYRGRAGHTYGFVVVGYDSAGNASALPATPQATTQT